MANAGQACEEGNLRKRVSRIDTEGRRSFRPLCGVERSILRRVYRVGGCHVRGVLGPFGPTGQPDPTIIQTAPRPDYFFLWLYALLSFLPPAAETPFLLVGPAI